MVGLYFLLGFHVFSFSAVFTNSPLFSGRGTLKHVNGDIFIGEFRGGVPHGDPTISALSRDGGCTPAAAARVTTIPAMRCSLGISAGAGMYRYNNETIFEGTWSDGHRHGEGVYRTRCVQSPSPLAIGQHAAHLTSRPRRTNAVYKEKTDKGRVVSRTRVK